LSCLGVQVVFDYKICIWGAFHASSNFLVYLYISGVNIQIGYVLKSHPSRQTCLIDPSSMYNVGNQEQGNGPVNTGLMQKAFICDLNST